ncbi:MAG: TIGR01777 family oxidoreductase [Cytophagales bacterium]|nr:TIGR01777 family oxidoreductase [Cytophagales bacterium]
MKSVLITGGSGLIGSRLTPMLQMFGYEVTHLSRAKKPNSKVPTFHWDTQHGYIDTKAFDHLDYVIHLAGTSVATQRWTSKRKAEIVSSRVATAGMLYDALKRTSSKIKTFIAASAIGIYGRDHGNALLTEESKRGNDFLSQVVKQWEAATTRMNTLGINVVQLRIGVVLSSQGGALPKIAAPIRKGLGAPFGHGEQWMSWIHIDDLCRMFIKAIEDSTMQGVYNAVAPYPVTNKDFTKTIAKVLHQPYFLPSIPPFILKLMLGERASLLLGSSRVSCKRIEEAGFKFYFPKLGPALTDLI